MSGRPPLQRPPTARPRRDGADEVPGPTAAETAGIESGAIGLVELAGATRVDDAELGATLLTWPGRGPAFNHVTRLRWTEADWRARANLAARRLIDIGEVPVIDVAEGLAAPFDIAERLRGEGWTEVGGELTLWTRRAAPVPHLALDLRLEAVTRRSVDEYEAVER
ncbi:MAG: hypothetical protein ACRDF7_08315, partial [Candidatus Limnocylindrales bacterium]